MTNDSDASRLVVHARPHPDPDVQRAGFPLHHRYVEQCWGPVIGPSSVVLLRRLPWLWQADTTLELDRRELGRCLGLTGGAGRHSTINRTLERVVCFGFGRWVGDQLEVFTEVRPLGPRHLAHVPTWTRVLHDQLLDAHLAHLATAAGRPFPSSPPPVSLASRSAQTNRGLGLA